MPNVTRVPGGAASGWSRLAGSCARFNGRAWVCLVTAETFVDEMQARIEASVDPALTATAPELIVVSNEVGRGIVPDTALARQICQAQGPLKVQPAARPQMIVSMTAGGPGALKGALA